MLKPIRKNEYRTIDYIISFLQVHIMEEKELQEVERRISFCEGPSDICKFLAKERYQTYLRNRKQAFLRAREARDYS
jgi:hypothetical protein